MIHRAEYHTGILLLCTGTVSSSAWDLWSLTGQALEHDESRRLPSGGLTAKANDMMASAFSGCRQSLCALSGDKPHTGDVGKKKSVRVCWILDVLEIDRGCNIPAVSFFLCVCLSSTGVFVESREGAGGGERGAC